MRASVQMIWNVISAAGRKFAADDCPGMAAAIAFYSLFSLPPLLSILVWIAGLAIDPTDAQGRVEEQIRSVTGEVAAQQIQALLKNAQQYPPDWFSRIMGTIVLVFAATGVVGQLQSSLNTIWQVKVDPQQKYYESLLIKRLLTLALVMIVGLLLLASLLVNAGLSMFGRQWAHMGPAGATDVLMLWIHSALTILLIAVIFGCMFRFLPDVKIGWREVALGSIVSALCFTFGNWLLGWYLSLQDLGSAYGSAGSLAVMLIWVYYSAMIFLFGAELTNQTSKLEGKRTEPAEGAKLDPSAK